jgi:hypothetical protein
MAQVGEHLPNNGKVPSTNPSTAKKKKVNKMLYFAEGGENISNIDIIVTPHQSEYLRSAYLIASKYIK